MGRLGHTLSTLRPEGRPPRTPSSLPVVGQTLPGGVHAPLVPPKGFFDPSYSASLLSQAFPGAGALRPHRPADFTIGSPPRGEAYLGRLVAAVAESAGSVRRWPCQHWLLSAAAAFG